MDVQHDSTMKTTEKRRMSDVSILFSFIIIKTMYIGVALYALENGQVTNSLTYIHNIVQRGETTDSTAKLVVGMLNELNQARFVILSFILLALLSSILTIAIVRKATSFVIFSGIICEMILLLAILALTISASQTQMYKHSNSQPYLFFPLFVGFAILKILAMKEVGLQFLSNIIKESCRVIEIYWLGILIMFVINLLALSSIIFGCYVFFQLLSTSLQPMYKDVQTEDGTEIEIYNFLIISVPTHIYLFHAINIISIMWIHNIIWNFGYVLFSSIFVKLYKDSEEVCNSIRDVVVKFKTIMRYQIGTIIYAASPCAFIIQILSMWKYAINSTNEYLKQKPFMGSLSWILTVYNLPETGLIFCSLHKTSFRESAKLVGRLFIHNPIRLLAIHAVLGWLSLFFVTFVTLTILTVFHIYIDLTSEQPWTGTAAVFILVGAVAMTGTVCQLFRIAVYSNYVFMVQNIQRVSQFENKMTVNPPYETMIVHCHDYINDLQNFRS